MVKNALFWINGMVHFLVLSGPLNAMGEDTASSNDVHSNFQLSAAVEREPLTQEFNIEQSARDIQNRTEEINRLTGLQGAYGDSLIEAHSDLGRLQDNSGNHRAAAAAYRQAWHLSRVNTGLYSEEQLPHLSALIESLIEAQEWQEVHDLHKLSFLIASRVYPPDDLRYSVAAEFYSNWQWEAISGQLLSGAMSDIFMSAQELSAFYTEVIDKIEHASSAQPQNFVNLILGKARTDISIARALVRAGVSRSVLGPGSYITESKCFDEVARNGANLRQCRRIYLAGFAEESGAMLSTNFALGRYLKQIELSIEKLEEICGNEDTVSPDEKLWVESLIAILKKESEGVYRSAGRMRT